MAALRLVTQRGRRSRFYGVACVAKIRRSGIFRLDGDLFWGQEGKVALKLETRMQRSRAAIFRLELQLYFETCTRVRSICGKWPISASIFGSARALHLLLFGKRGVLKIAPVVCVDPFGGGGGPLTHLFLEFEKRSIRTWSAGLNLATFRPRLALARRYIMRHAMRAQLALFRKKKHAPPQKKLREKRKTSKTR